MKLLKYLLIFIPISIFCEILHVNPNIMFVISALSIIPLAGLMGEATEEVSAYSGPRIGGFLNATFGNATELIISIFALRAGLFEVVKASITGSVIGNILLVLGASMMFGGFKHKVQKFNKKIVEVSSSMLLFSVLALSLPTIFKYTIHTHAARQSNYEILSIVTAIIMFLIYILSLYFSFYTHKEIYTTGEEEAKETNWSLRKAIGILMLATVLIAIESEFLVSSVEHVTKSLGLSEFFVGIILIPIIGNAAEHSTAIIMAMKNKMDVAVEIAIGSSLQIVLFVTPVLIFLSLIFSKHMDIIFKPFELVAFIAAALIANRVSSDGESNWLEGVELTAVYLIIAIALLIL